MSNKLYDEDTMMGDYFGDDKPVANAINASELKPCPFCGSTKIRKPKNEKGWLCKKCGSEIFWDWNTRPIEDALNERIAELEYNAANNAMSIHAIMSTLDIDDETHGIADDMYETARNLAHKLRAHAERAEAERDDARAMVDKLIEAGNKSVHSVQTEFCTHWSKEWRALVTEWKESEK